MAAPSVKSHAQNWFFTDNIPAEEITNLQQALNISKPLACILVQRGINTYDKAKDFFNPDLSQLYDPFLMKDLDKGVERLHQAIVNKEKILLFGDYDVDGTTALGLFYNFLCQVHKNCEYYVPDRFTEGYGISDKGIDYAASQNVNLIISLDCGIRSADKVAYAAQKNIDFIVCDHHEPGPALPQAAAVLDPKRKDCPYPFKELSGCGVGFKLLQGYCISKAPEKLSNLFNLVDFLAVSICADLVDMNSENRILCAAGIEKLCQSPNNGLRALMEVAALRQDNEGVFEVNVRDIVFGLSPRINAAGRLSHAKAAVDMFTGRTQDKESIEELADILHKHNSDRQQTDSQITKEALAQIKKSSKKYTSVLHQEDWHKGVVGIVASRCIEHYYRPTIVLTTHEGKLTGSARSVEGFDLYSALLECDDLIEQWGGHTHAAGMTLLPENLTALRNRFEQVVADRIQPNQLKPTVSIDAEINFNQLTKNFNKVLKRMEPHGPGDMQPVFLTRNVKDDGSARTMTNRDREHVHLKLSIYQPAYEGLYFDAVAFGMSNWYAQAKKGTALDICYTVSENNFNGKTKIQLMVKDIRVADKTDVAKKLN